jgi:hypothetical protein
MEIPLLSSSRSEDFGVGRNECDLYVMKTVQYVSIDEKNTNKSKRVASSHQAYRNIKYKNI